MARVIEFNPDDALEKAMRVFWHKGYTRTSVRDLVAETGVAHAGLYNVFGGKRQIFEASLERYNNTIVRSMLEGLEGKNASRVAIEDFFQRSLFTVKTQGFHDGCLMCNTAIGFGEAKGKSLMMVKCHFERVVNAFTNALTNAMERGEVPKDLELGPTAEFFACTLYGVATLIRMKAKSARVERVIKIALKVLG